MYIIVVEYWNVRSTLVICMFAHWVFPFTQLHELDTIGKTAGDHHGSLTVHKKF